MQKNRSIQFHTEIRCDSYVIVVAMSTNDSDGIAACDRVDDRTGRMRGIDDHHLVVVTDQPDVVVDLPLATIERERPRRDHLLDPQLPTHRTTTERSTVP